MSDGARTIGILGGGQLGQMLAQAGAKLGLRTRVFDPKKDACARSDAELFTGSFDDEAALERFARGLSWATFEWENVPVAALRKVESLGVPVFPSPKVLEITQDRLFQKKFFASHGIETAPFAEVSSQAELESAVARLGLPAVLKTRREGYDGKGQLVLRAPGDVAGAWERLGSRPLILEGFVAFEREVSIVAARSTSGQIAFYPLSWNFHREGILRWSLAPAPGLELLQPRAEAIARRALEALDYVGTLAIELFVKTDQAGDRLLVNELAPRVHNSGHWTQDGARASQFENHLRAGVGGELSLPLGEAALTEAAAGMVNLIGIIPDESRLRAAPGAHFHLYGKSPAPGRKIGHLNFTGGSLSELRAQMNAALAVLGENPIP